MKRSTDRILTTHVGSLVRPASLRDMIKRRESGEAIGPDAYDSELKKSVAGVVAQQTAIGIDIPSDGEYGKLGWTSYIANRLNGLSPRETGPDDKEMIDPRMAGREGTKFLEFFRAYDPVQSYDWSGPEFFSGNKHLRHVGVSGLVECTGPLTYKHGEIERDIANFKAALTGQTYVEAFMPVAAPESAKGARLNRFYESDDAFLAALADALKTEYHAIVDAGFLIQLDDAYFTQEYDRQLITQSEAAVHRKLGAYIELLNTALKGIPPQKVRYHVCWGSWNIPHTSDVPLKTIVDLILSVNAGAYSLEAAGPRHAHEYQVWEDVKLPDGKILLPGVISHATNVVEHPELVALRIKQFARLVGRENVIASSDCGFSQTWNHIRLHPQIQWAKLETLVEGAKLATKELWKR